MINQLTPDQISIHWEELSKGFNRAIPPYAGGGTQLLLNLLESCISGRMQVWAWTEADVIQGAVLTTITTDPGTFTRNLYIYALYTREGKTPQGVWAEGYEVLGAFAQANKCYAVTAFSDTEGMESLTKLVGMKPFMMLYYKEI